MKTALITGITGQDGMYLFEFLNTRGYMNLASPEPCILALQI